MSPMLAPPRPTKRYMAYIQDGHVPAPMGGLNTISAGSAMPESDCPVLINMVAAENGLRSRLGWREWCTNLGGLPVRSMLPFTGATKNGAANRLFACTQTGIWDVSASSQTPTQVVAFPSSTQDSGWGVCAVMVTSAGHFLLYTDEENGLYLYTSASDSWMRVVSATQTAWTGPTAYVAGNLVTNGGNVYLCTVGGTSAGAGGPSGTGTGIVDGAVTWDFNFSISNVDPATFVSVCVWKNRAWFTVKDSSKSYFLGTLSIAGAATLQNWGGQFRAGGCLVGLWNWTVDGAVGIDDFLVGISSGGDVVIYQGTDPTTATTFGIKGVWFVAGVPSGRRIATSFGGDLLIMSSVGLVQLSKLITGNVAEDVSQYSTLKIGNLFNLQVLQYGGNRGWSCVLHPQDNSLLALIPVADNQATNQLVMSLTTRSWGQYQGLPIFSASAWNSSLYFGTADGRVCVNDGYVDGVTLAAPGVSTPIQWFFVTAFQNLGTAKRKQVQVIRPFFNSQTSIPSFSAQARYDFDLTGLPSVALLATVDPNTWDSGTWDSAIWQPDYVASNGLAGAYGVGSNVAIAMAGTAISRTILVGMDVAFTIGGML